MSRPAGAAGLLLGAGLVGLGLWLRGRKSGSEESMSTDDRPLAWPLWGRITSPFGPRPAPVAGASTNHNGIDIAAVVGTEIRAPADGRVLATWEDLSHGGGYSLRVDHGEGLVTGYAHLVRWVVSPGQRVQRGQLLAYSGGLPGAPGAGISSGPHLHFTVRLDGVAVDPVPLLEV